jgi:hypothetical protein
MNAYFKHGIRYKGIEKSEPPSRVGILLFAYFLGIFVGCFLVYWGWLGLLVSFGWLVL